MKFPVLKKQHDAIPAPTTIMQEVFGQDTTADRTAAAATVQSIMANLGDVVELFYLASQIKVTSRRHVELLTEQAALEVAVTEARAQAEAAKKESASAIVACKTAASKTETEIAGRVAGLQNEVKALETRKTTLAKSIEGDQTAKLRLDSTVKAEYDRLRKEMLVKVAGEEKEARKGLDDLNSQVDEAEGRLKAATDALAELKGKL